ncbi:MULTISPECIES: porin [Burkholderiaceae]|uniref:Outer membrane protein (Porin) n=1 Tax=Caballeronia sordidicola TaxID=196367 RepID=A0A242M686_CABSO|nr:MULTISPECIES: porin [Burkholderiaceae]AME28453.1 porin [Burkholderia sp. PAMC 26561]OTP66343.1 Outer membrane protein (porin) [Caballeronia sordidicola]
MKNIWLAAAFSGIWSLAAHAQSSVTLYGVLDEGFQFNTNAKNVVKGVNVGGRQLTVDSINGLNGSRWGFRGTEDLGDGLKAIFDIQGGINLNTGAFAQGGTPFGRTTYVGLSSRSYGTVTFGRQYDLVVAYVQPVTSTGYIGGSTTFGHPVDLDNLVNTLRVNNSIKYVSPDFNGLNFGAEASLGGQPGNVTGGGGYSFGASYNHGPITLGAGYNFFKNPTGPTAGTGLFTDNVSGANSLSGVLNSNYITASSYQVAAVGGTYAIGPALIGLTYSNTQYGNVASLGGVSPKFNDVEAGLRWQFTPAFFAGFAYNYTTSTGVEVRGETLGDQHYHQIAVLADYFLSKRTDVYFTAAVQKASGVSSTGSAAVANIGGLGDSSNDRQAVMRIALRHKF